MWFPAPPRPNAFYQLALFICFSTSSGLSREKNSVRHLIDPNTSKSMTWEFWDFKISIVCASKVPPEAWGLWLGRRLAVASLSWVLNVFDYTPWCHSFGLAHLFRWACICKSGHAPPEAKDQGLGWKLRCRPLQICKNMREQISEGVSLYWQAKLG